jgi:hypothetical protein
MISRDGARTGDKQANQATGTAKSRRVCGEFQFMRQLGFEISRCSVAASDMTEGLRLEEKLRRCVEPAWLRPTRCDTGVGCSRPCNSRASAQDRFGSKIGSDRDTYANDSQVSTSTAYSARISNSPYTGPDNEADFHWPRVRARRQLKRRSPRQDLQ